MKFSTHLLIKIITVTLIVLVIGFCYYQREEIQKIAEYGLGTWPSHDPASNCKWVKTNF